MLINLAVRAKPLGVARYIFRRINQNSNRMSLNNFTTLLQMRTAMISKGWSLRTAAPLLGVHWTHLHKVLQGERKSAALLVRIKNLPKRKLQKS